MDTAVTVAIVSAGGIIGSTIIQALNTASANKRADQARDDERRQDELRRNEERAAQQARLEAERTAAKEQAEQERIAQERAERNSAAAAFMTQAEKCYGLMQLGKKLSGGTQTSVIFIEWTELSRLLGDFVLLFDPDLSGLAREIVQELQAAIPASDYPENMQKAERHLEVLANLLRQLS
jgi:hypothetical protein